MSTMSNKAPKDIDRERWSGTLSRLLGMTKKGLELVQAEKNCIETGEEVANYVLVQAG